MTRARTVMLVATILLLWSSPGCDPGRDSRQEPREGSPAATAEASGSVEAAGSYGPTEEIVIDGRRFELELALTSEARYQGLSDRQHIPKDGGMLFVFPDAARRTFVMRRCLVPIDLIYLDAETRVLNTHRMEVEPYDRSDWFLTRYRSDGAAQYVIELAGGTLDELDLSRGDRIDIPPDLKRRAR